MAKWNFVTPAVKQTFVTAGASLNSAGGAMVMAYTSGLLPQLKRPDSEIPIDEYIGSWIAATPGLSMILGNFLIPYLMSRFGRKISNLISITSLILGWLCLVLAKNVLIIIIARFIQGIAMGSSLTLAPILIAEYTSPKNRGLFLMTIGQLSALNVLIGHTVNSFCSWQTTSLTCMTLAIINLPIVLYSPESPTWLAKKGRYKDCKEAFRWLRGDNEEEELKALIKSSIIEKARMDKDFAKSPRINITNILPKLKETITKKEFYKPIIIMVHLYAICQWAGVNSLCTYSIDIFEKILGKNVDATLHIAILDVQRIISNTIAMYIVKKMKRRTMFISITSVNILATLAIAAYVYAKSINLFESSIVGVALVHIHMFTVASCTLPLPFIIAGEVFPVKYKGIGSGISILSFALNFSINVKTFPFLFETIGMYGAYCLYAGVVSYCLLIAYIFLPETKDRTLQDIEKEFTGEDKPLSLDELKSVESLMVTL